MQVQLQDKLSAHVRDAANQVASVPQVYFSKRRAVTRVCILAYAPEGCLCGFLEQSSPPLSISLTVSVVPNMMPGRRLHHARATTFEQSTFTDVDEVNIISLVETNKIH